MNIVMLGHSGAGKTSYVSLMYAMLNDGAGGFRITAAPDDDLLLRSNAGEIRRGRYPYASSLRSSFDFMLRYAGADVFPFRWHDNRGAALEERVRDSPQAAELQADLRTADGILLFVDSADLLAGRADRAVRSLTTQVLRALHARGRRLTPLAILLTKADLVDFSRPDVAARLRAPFRPIVDTVARTLHVQGTFVPVSCGPQPIGVRLPVLWMLHLGILNRATSLSKTTATTDGRAEAARLRHLVEPAERLGELLHRMDRF
ncbi:TRAFAC clade GTPase domain-containing protein [Micromonospora sp. WMMD730]|uniref:TRAFAC clade GTPase domain-containing protein n=1 Tax=Micromonospora sp. WMMD730 TaxID=3404128 RepID=UPI003B93A741